MVRPSAVDPGRGRRSDPALIVTRHGPERFPPTMAPAGPRTGSRGPRAIARALPAARTTRIHALRADAGDRTALLGPGVPRRGLRVCALGRGWAEPRRQAYAVQAARGEPAGTRGADRRTVACPESAWGCVTTVFGNQHFARKR